MNFPVNLNFLVYFNHNYPYHIHRPYCISQYNATKPWYRIFSIYSISGIKTNQLPVEGKLALSRCSSFAEEILEFVRSHRRKLTMQYTKHHTTTSRRMHSAILKGVRRCPQVYWTVQPIRMNSSTPFTAPAWFSNMRKDILFFASMLFSLIPCKDFNFFYFFLRVR